MDQKINNANLSFTCTQDWNSMQPVAGGRFCDTCQKKVYDLTDKNVAFFVKIMQENNNKVCGRFTSDQLIVPDQKPGRPYWKRWIIAAMVFIGFNTAAQKVKAQAQLMGKVAPKPLESDCEIPTLLGEVAIVSTPVQLKMLHAYVVKKCRVPASVNGRVMASFTVGKNGALQNLAVSNHLGQKVREEVLNVLKTAAKWKNADELYAHPYSLYIDFKNGKIRPYPQLTK
ncbi:hypothetical protein [Pedobacter heparinus]|uniref:hypothetical protein n=1 Tax=Pedobacter heparinus TaxID=984 RepID=UPI00292CF340|nr:hypothetical protein [Pedobacter heparinus]